MGIRAAERLRVVLPERSFALMLVEALAADPVSLARLRELVGDVGERPENPGAPAYTVATLSAALGVSPRVVRNAIQRGELRAVKRGSRWYIAADVVDAWTHEEARAPRSRRAGRDRPLKGSFQRLNQPRLRA